jgi:hypothetical protein
MQTRRGLGERAGLPLIKKQRCATLEECARNPTQDISKLTVPQLKQILRVDSAESKQLRKPELLQRLQKLLLQYAAAASDGSSRANEALDASSSASYPLSKLHTCLLVMVSHFLDGASIAMLAACHRFLRARMTLAPSDRPSPALLALRRIHAVHPISPTVLNSLLASAKRVEFVSFKVDYQLEWDDFGVAQLPLVVQPPLALPSSVTCVDITAPVCLATLLRCIASCSKLTSARFCSAFGDEKKSSVSRFVFSFPHLHTLVLEGGSGDNDAACAMRAITACPQLRVLKLLSMFDHGNALCLDALVDNLVKLPHFHSLTLGEANASVSLKPLVNLTELTNIALLNRRAKILDVPPTLVRLCCGLRDLQLIDKGDIPQLRHLIICDHHTNDLSNAVRRAVAIARGIETLEIVAEDLDESDNLSAVVAAVDQVRPKSFPKLQRLRLHLDRINDAPGPKDVVKQAQKTLKLLRRKCPGFVLEIVPLSSRSVLC